MPRPKPKPRPKPEIELTPSRHQWDIEGDLIPRYVEDNDKAFVISATRDELAREVLRLSKQKQ